MLSIIDVDLPKLGLNWQIYFINFGKLPNHHKLFHFTVCMRREKRESTAYLKSRAAAEMTKRETMTSR